MIVRNMMLMDLKHSASIIGPLEQYKHEAARDLEKAKRLLITLEFFSMLKGWQLFCSTYKELKQ